jgi:hypothetical protein
MSSVGLKDRLLGAELKNVYRSVIESGGFACGSFMRARVVIILNCMLLLM